MKKLITIMIVFFAASTAFAQIANSAHDFTVTGKWNAGGEICITCHTPHDALSSDAPLWNHATTVATFTVYASNSLDADVSSGPSTSSKLCLSCHDGTVAMDNFGGTTTGTQLLTGSAVIGTDLSNDHPVSFIYDGTLATADGGLNDPSTTLSGLGAHIDDDMLIGGSMECASCHDVHNGAGVVNLLVKANSGSALCLTCHDK